MYSPIVHGAWESLPELEQQARWAAPPFLLCRVPRVRSSRVQPEQATRSRAGISCRGLGQLAGEHMPGGLAECSSTHARCELRPVSSAALMCLPASAESHTASAPQCLPPRRRVASRCTC
eukprot:scaffold1385_cov403-Prasinococcus_capsulatus_cf.AAC.7